MFARRTTTPSCFYCLSPQHIPPRDPLAFHCDACGTYNQYSRETGEIIGDEPAMRNEMLNTGSFSKRGSNSQTNLTASFAHSPFCRTCQTNQMLLLNLISNYLPDQDDPNYPQLLAQFPTYRASLEQRYPPVCRTCQVAVDEELQKKAQMARAAALGGRLRTTRQLRTQRTTKRQQPRDVMVWYARGVLWGLTELATLVSFTLAMVGRLDAGHIPPPLATISFVLLSFSWAFWDPTWLTVRRATLQGKRIRVSGRPEYIKYQMVSWLSRLVVSCLVAADMHDAVYFSQPVIWFAAALLLDLACLVMSFLSLSIQRPVAIRLLDSSAQPGDHSQPAGSTPTPAPAPSDELEPHIGLLSLDAQPVMPKPVEPVFGQTSLPVSSSPLLRGADDDEMDWTPTNPSNAESIGEDGSWLRPQMFFAPEKPTGLESLFERTSLAEDVATSSGVTRPVTATQPRTKRRWYILAALALAAVSFLWGMSAGATPRISRLERRRATLRRNRMFMEEAHAFGDDIL